MAQQAADAAERYARTQPPPAAGSPPGSGGAGGAGGQRLPGGFVKRSDSEIQRAYDAAAGPPAKGELGPPSAPPPPPPPAGAAGAPMAPSPPSAAGVAGGRPVESSGASSNGAGDDLGLPSAPGAVRPASGGGADNSEVDAELAELTRRFEALKRR